MLNNGKSFAQIIILAIATRYDENLVGLYPNIKVNTSMYKYESKYVRSKCADYILWKHNVNCENKYQKNVDGHDKHSGREHSEIDGSCMLLKPTSQKNSSIANEVE